MRALIVDGYNALHAWPRLRPLTKSGQLEAARRGLVDQLAEFAAATGVDVTVVFDSHRNNGAVQVEQIDGISVRFGTAAASADHVIERLAFKATRHGLDHDVIVATSDRLQRELVIAMGVGVMTTLELCSEVERVAGGTRDVADDHQRQADMSNRLEERIDPEVRRRLEAMRRDDSTP